MSRLTGSLLLALALALIAPPVSLAKPKDGEPPKPPKKKDPTTLVGILLKVEGTDLVLQTHGKNASEITVKTDKNTKFELNDAAITLAEVKPGMQIVVTPPTGVAQKVVAEKILPDKKKPKEKDKKKPSDAK
jgi:hypothetical protein